MRMTAKQKRLAMAPHKRLYLGTTELVAKSALVEPVEGPFILTNTYAGSFAMLEGDGRWGIIEVDIECLFEKKFLPFHGYLERINRPKRTKVPLEKRRQAVLNKIDTYKTSWFTSLERSGSCLYNATLLPAAINRIGIFNPRGNDYVVEAFGQVDPWDVSPEDHKKNFLFYNNLCRWLACQAVDPLDWMKSKPYREVAAIDTKLMQKDYLDLFYERSQKSKEQPPTWWSIE